MPLEPAVLLPLWTLLGFAVGSFLNAAADRIPAGQSLITPPSRCGACGKRLRPIELVPVFSYLAQRGRCRSCGGAIGARTLLVELGTGILFCLAAWRCLPASASAWLQLVLVSLYLAILVLVTVTDLEHGLIPNRAMLPAIALALVGALLSGWPEMLYHLLGGVLGAGVIVLVILLVPRGMGWGDARLAGFVGLITGLPGVLFALFVGFVSGGLVAGTLLATGRRHRGDTVPLGPFLALGGGAALLYAEEMLAAFKALAGG
jgi:leader peptidase (prepilin peptidase)/N-methyltransferase